MRPFALAALALLAGCGGGEEAPENRGIGTEQIRRVSTPPNLIKQDPTAAIAIQPLTPIESALVSPGCRFVRNGHTLVVATGGDAIARIAGSLRHFVQTAPVTASGIFLEDRQVSISIGRTAAEGDAAMLRITNRTNAAQRDWAGTWSCIG
jgi:hypothetical protein